ncbi:hypothetical protein ACFSJQ_17850 [Vibrio olivae]
MWVELKHTGQNNGVGRVNWSSDIRDEVRARATGVESIGRQVRTLVSDNPNIFDPKTINNIKKIPVTTLTRLFSSSPAQNAFKLQVENKNLVPAVPLENIAPSIEFAISMFVQEGYNVNDIRGDKDRRLFIGHIPPELLPKKDPIPTSGPKASAIDGEQQEMVHQKEHSKQTFKILEPEQQREALKAQMDRTTRNQR